MTCVLAALWEEALGINRALIFHFFLLHLLMQNMFHLNDPWAKEVTGLLAGRRIFLIGKMLIVFGK